MVALLSAFGGYLVFRCAPKLVVLMVTCVAVTEACAAAWPWRAAMFSAQEHRALVGHAIGNYSGLTPVRCAVLCLLEDEAQCRSFNYDHTGRICQLNSARWQDFSKSLVEDLNFSYYGLQVEQEDTDLVEHQTTPAPEWQLVFRGVAGKGVKLYDMWTAATWDETTLGVGGSWRDDSLYMAWHGGVLEIKRVKLSLYDAEKVGRAELIFNGVGSDTLSWFAKDGLISSPWQDLNSTTVTTHFSIPGHAEEDRRFYINHNYGGCPHDYGWLVVTDSNVLVDCEYERAPTGSQYPIILYSNTTGKVLWHEILTGSNYAVGRANYLTIHIDVA